MNVRCFHLDLAVQVSNVAVLGERHITLFVRMDVSSSITWDDIIERQPCKGEGGEFSQVRDLMLSSTPQHILRTKQFATSSAPRLLKRAMRSIYDALGD